MWIWLEGDWIGCDMECERVFLLFMDFDVEFLFEWMFVLNVVELLILFL